jgi:hypothetical protein
MGISAFANCNNRRSIGPFLVIWKEGWGSMEFSDLLQVGVGYGDSRHGVRAFENEFEICFFIMATDYYCEN